MRAPADVDDACAPSPRAATLPPAVIGCGESARGGLAGLGCTWRRSGAGWRVGRRRGRSGAGDRAPAWQVNPFLQGIDEASSTVK